jgi:hypothetical protein
VNNDAQGDYSTQRPPAASVPVPRGACRHGTAIQVESISLLGVRVTACAVLNDAEHDRRQAAGIKAITDPALLDRLLDLPHATLVADAAAWAELRLQPQGIVECGQVTGVLSRLLEPPLVILEVIVPAPDGRELGAVQEASMFAGFARRWAAVARERVPDPVMLEAKLAGVGIRTRQGTILIPAEDPACLTLDGWAWLLREKTYSRWLSRQSQEIAPGNPRPATGGARTTPVR